MQTKSLVLFRSKSTNFKEENMEKAPVPNPRTICKPSAVKEKQIQTLANRRLMRPKTEVGWRPVVGEEFLTKGTGETVVFLTYIERGFSVPSGDFLRSLLFFYRIKLVHLVPNSITTFLLTSISARPTSALRHISSCGATSWS
jgi:hypothetical protein